MDILHSCNTQQHFSSPVNMATTSPPTVTSAAFIRSLRKKGIVGEVCKALPPPTSIPSFLNHMSHPTVAADRVLVKGRRKRMEAAFL